MIKTTTRIGDMMQMVDIRIIQLMRLTITFLTMVRQIIGSFTNNKIAGPYIEEEEEQELVVAPDTTGTSKGEDEEACLRQCLPLRPR